ncbi:hypothetical protein AY599_18985 [Leptolyngbya valderiana BDU 20041]|nr:hypothetical protein AY599_18985 [Leptolyngbya valderiana BDU 20041]
MLSCNDLGIFGLDLLSIKNKKKKKFISTHVAIEEMCLSYLPELELNSSLEVTRKEILLLMFVLFSSSVTKGKHKPLDGCISILR